MKEKPEKNVAAAAVKRNALSVSRWPLISWREQRYKPAAPKRAAIGNKMDNSSFLTMTAKRIRLNDCTDAATGPTNAIVEEARNVLRQVDCWVDLPPRVFAKAFPKALEKDESSPIKVKPL